MMYLEHIVDSLTKLRAKNSVDSTFQMARVKAAMASLCLRSEDMLKDGNLKLMAILQEKQKG